MRIAVTGASGFVGRAVLRAGSAGGHEMVAVTRAATTEQGVPVRSIRDLADTDGLRAAFAGVDAVVHLAARVHVMHAEGAGAIERFRTVNVEGTRSVLEAARSAGVGRVAVFSTAKVLGEGRHARVLRDDDPLQPEGAYAQSKAEMERLVAATADLSCVILRPPLVYGPGVGGNFRRLLQLARIAAIVPLPLGSVHNRRSMVFVRNLADATLHALVDVRSRGRAYLVSDGEDLSTTALLERLGRHGARPVRLLPFPPSLMRMVLTPLGRGAEADRLFESFAVDSSAIQRDLGWRPPHAVDVGLAETVRWWQDGRGR
jgi:nucleoside-diphosphate-sugar epimerase